MSAGILLLMAGSWILAQVLRGNALQRLGILAGGDQAAPLTNPGSAVGSAVAAGAAQAGRGGS